MIKLGGTTSRKLIIVTCLVCFLGGCSNSPRKKETSNQEQSKTERATIVPKKKEFHEKKELPKKKKIPDSVTAIGDSVMLGAAPLLQKKIKHSVIDAKECRQVSKGKEILERLKAKGKLGSTVIIALGTNGVFRKSVGQKLIDYLGKNRTIYWVLVYGKHLKWMDEVNTTIRELAAENANVHSIDWAKEGASHTEWFYQDGIHLKPEGRKGYAKLITDTITQ